MNSLEASEIKKTGATFTSQALAEFLAQKLVSYLNIKTDLVALDPACGDGALLSAIQSRLPNVAMRLIGYDTNAVYLQQAKKVLCQTRVLHSIKKISCQFALAKWTCLAE